MSQAPAPPERRGRLRFARPRPPKPLLRPETERQLTARQLEVLEGLETLVVESGVAGLTMAEIAAQMNCSLRTLYGIAPSKEELVLAVVDRRLHGIGRVAMDALDATLPPMQALRLYLQAVTEAVQPTTAAFTQEFANVPGAKRLLDAHEDYVIAVTQGLLDRAVEEGDIPPVDTSAVAHVLGGFGREFSRPELRQLIREDPKQTVLELSEIVLRGLERSGPPRERA